MKISLSNGNKIGGIAGFLASLVVMTLAVLLAAYLLPGIHISNLWTAFLASLVIALLNRFLKPLMVILTLPFTVFSLGLFLFVINAAIVELASLIVPSFDVENFWWALLFGFLLTVFNFLLELPNRLHIHKHHNGEKPDNDNSNDDHFDHFEEIKD